MNFIGRETKIRSIFIIHDGIYGKIVEPTENAFLCNTENSGQKSIGQVFIILECPGKKVPHKTNDIIVEFSRITFLNWSVILIDHDDRCNSIMFFQHPRQTFQCGSKINFCHMVTIENFPEIFFVIISNLWTVKQIDVTMEFRLKKFPDLIHCWGPWRKFYVFKGEKDNRISSLLFTIRFSAFPDRLILKIDAGVLIGYFEKDAEHIHI